MIVFLVGYGYKRFRTYYYFSDRCWNRYDARVSEYGLFHLEFLFFHSPLSILIRMAGDEMRMCRGVTKSDFSYGYDQDIKDFIEGKTYPYGSW